MAYHRLCDKYIRIKQQLTSHVATGVTHLGHAENTIHNEQSHHPVMVSQCPEHKKSIHQVVLGIHWGTYQMTEKSKR